MRFHSRCRKKKRGVQMAVTMPGSFVLLGGRGKAKRGVTTPVAIVLDRGEVVFLVLDPKTQVATHRLTIDGSESLVSAIHALETASW